MQELQSISANFPAIARPWRSARAIKLRKGVSWAKSVAAIPLAFEARTPNRVSKNLDQIDLKILSEIQADGRITNVELAKRVGISRRPACAG